MSTQQIYDAVKRAARENLGTRQGPISYLDIGAGRGQLITQLAAGLPVEAHACDYHTELFNVASAPIAKVNLNVEKLPYADASFDLVTCSEVIEHVENYRALVREAHRVLKKDGLLILTTPNVLNLKSRFRYLTAGFANLFGPLPVGNEKLYSTGGHITPIPYFYLAHALLDAGFRDIKPGIDKKQKTSLALLPFALPLLTFGWRSFLRKEQHKYKTMTQENRSYVLAHRSLEILTGRTLVVSAKK